MTKILALASRTLVHGWPGPENKELRYSVIGQGCDRSEAPLFIAFYFTWHSTHCLEGTEGSEHMHVTAVGSPREWPILPLNSVRTNCGLASWRTCALEWVSPDTESGSATSSCRTSPSWALVSSSVKWGWGKYYSSHLIMLLLACILTMYVVSSCLYYLSLRARSMFNSSVNHLRCPSYTVPCSEAGPNNNKLYYSLLPN